MQTSANSPTSIYLDTFNKHPSCADDEKVVKDKCKPEPEQSEEDKKKGKPKPERKGLGGKLATAAKALDDAGKLAAGYKRDPGSKTAFDGNGWMEDHCTGQWISPIHTADPEFEKKLTEMLENIEDKRLRLMLDGFDELVEVAVAKVGPVAQEMATNFLIRAGLKAGVGVLTAETLLGPYLMGAWTATDLVLTAKELAAMAGDKGKAALDALEKTKNIGDKAKDILGSYKKEPHRAHADAMSLMAQLDTCLRARKCLLVPYKNADSDGRTDKEESARRTAASGKKATVTNSKAKSQAKHGHGCCPGQTGHHILPNAMVEGADCPGYDYDNAPTMCLEGANNAALHGSHGMAHNNLKVAMFDYTKKTGKSKLSYADAKKHAIDAVQMAGAIQCKRECLEAQLDAHYKCDGKELNANAGVGGGTKRTPPPVNNTDNG
ncbi:hypothetical protein F2P44_18975 [Massilia sp. CCM 8695]|uniref:Tox-GHH2 domain-containing protein n=1 Tax=Massilia frigida TaxID=2609281 RepID=A0ABX0N8C8_9BURK|nr:HNH/endonuclease VII fold toxin-2 domain-containing protein [Massilia frigida]NHZ81342.1 hypothetical protein [Massilia frigida]